MRMVSMSVVTSCSLPRRCFVTSPAAFEDGNVLLHGGEAHRVARGERRHRVPTSHRAAHDVAAGGVAEGAEHPVRPLVGELIYNHLVVC